MVFHSLVQRRRKHISPGKRAESAPARFTRTTRPGALGPKGSFQVLAQPEPFPEWPESTEIPPCLCRVEAFYYGLPSSPDLPEYPVSFSLHLPHCIIIINPLSVFPPRMAETQVLYIFATLEPSRMSGI